MQASNTSSRNARRRGHLVILCVAGILINFLGVQLARWLNLPLFLDIVGTALAGALGGVIPGIIVGFFTNLVNGFFDIETAYYS